MWKVKGGREAFAAQLWLVANKTFVASARPIEPKFSYEAK